ncbi:MAG: hypothetical protein P4L55_13985 [Syntrophobacteraceae bacterium]|nr:hypothetical protein [Syntrophobacteraceae bacterium]
MGTRAESLGKMGGIEMDVAEGILLVAIGCGRLPGMVDAAAKRSRIVFGTMDVQVLAELAVRLGESASEISVYFYESG